MEKAESDNQPEQGQRGGEDNAEVLAQVRVQLTPLVENVTPEQGRQPQGDEGNREKQAPDNG